MGRNEAAQHWQDRWRCDTVTEHAQQAQAARASSPAGWPASEISKLENGVVELVVRNQGGHFAEFRFSGSTGASSTNMLWESPWRYERLENARPQDLADTAGFTGHGLCLDNFGAPSSADAAKGLVQHGEAARSDWKTMPGEEIARGAAAWSVRLPVAQLDFERRVRLGSGESVAFIEEKVTNLRDEEHVCDWVQHATFGPPFVTREDTRFFASATRGLTAPDGYGPDSLVESNREFNWPFAPAAQVGNERVDLRLPFAVRGKGITAAVQMDPGRDVEFIAGIHRTLRVGAGYCFRREDFPWLMIWEENCVRQDRPWYGTTQARGMEFGSTPLPGPREATMRRGRLFETPSWCTIPAKKSKTARYLMFLFRLPIGFDAVGDIAVSGDSIDMVAEDGTRAFSIPARGCESFLS
jgi:hypothetical protein